jgi:predicted nucleic acid-binding protein
VILIDTSVWIAHLRRRLPGLTTLLEQQRVLTHPFVIGELACGQIRQRSEILRLINELPAPVSATHDEVLRMIEDRKLWGKGIGFVDFHLLASAMIGRCQLWSTDRGLNEVAAEFKLSWRPKPR